MIPYQIISIILALLPNLPFRNLIGADAPLSFFGAAEGKQMFQYFSKSIILIIEATGYDSLMDNTGHGGRRRTGLAVW